MAAVGFVLAAAGAAEAGAQTIGRAATVRNEVARLQGPRVIVVNVGDSVVRNDVVRTGGDSATKLVFTDNTNLAVGPNARVTLDSFVFSGGGSYKKAVLTLARGAARFTTGGSAKRAYKIETDVATIGVRGTIFDLLAEPGRTVVTLVEGQVIVCARGRRQCETISVPGQSVVVTSGGVSPAAPGEQAPSVCDQAAGLCTPTRFAEVPRTRVGQLPAPPVPVVEVPTTIGSAETPADFSGFYVGGFGGYAAGSSSQRDNGYTVVRPVATQPPASTVVASTPTAPTTPATTTTTTTTTPRTGGSVGIGGADGSYRVGGGIGGGLLGYNFKIGRIVVGAEGDIGGGSISGRSTACGTTPHTCGTTLSSIATVRGRIGVPLNRVMPFVTAGPAFERISAYDSLMRVSGKVWRTGYAVGGGFDYKVTPFATVRLEYIHAGFSGAHLFDIVPGVPERVSAHSDVVRVGVIIGSGALSLLQR